VTRTEPDGRITVLADSYGGKRLNSPNDVVVRSDGSIWFTDPAYGIDSDYEGHKAESEIGACHVYRVDPGSGAIRIAADDFVRPNGLAFSPDERILYVASSDPDKAIWMSYPVKPDGSLGPGRVFFDVTSSVKARKGLPDGMKVDQRGNLWATGPGGVLILSPAGKHLGTLATGEATANCAWGDDGSTLYITADMYLCRVRTKVKGAGL
jgi:gluconolactonase